MRAGRAGAGGGAGGGAGALAGPPAAAAAVGGERARLAVAEEGNDVKDDLLLFVVWRADGKKDELSSWE